MPVINASAACVKVEAYFCFILHPVYFSKIACLNNNPFQNLFRTVAYEGFSIPLIIVIVLRGLAIYF